MATIKDEEVATVSQRIRHELVTFLALAAYLYVCFGALVLLKMSILEAEGIRYLAFGTPIIKALILAKFIMLGEMARLGARRGSERVITVILRKAFLYLGLLIVLTIVEEALIAMFHGEEIGASLYALWSGKLWQILSNSFVMLLILMPYVAARELDRAVGGRLWKILTESDELN